MRCLAITVTLVIALTGLISSDHAHAKPAEGKYVCRELLDYYSSNGKLIEQTPDEKFHIFEIMKTKIIEHFNGNPNLVELYEYKRVDSEANAFWNKNDVAGVKVDAALRVITFRFPYLSQSVLTGNTIFSSQYKCQFLE